jgi:putative transcriptional regulator
MTFRLAGQLLVSKPILIDPNFDGTITLLVEHNDDGALGLVLNRPSSLTVADAFPEWADVAASPGVVFAGGPVERNSLVALGASPEADGDLILGLHSVDLDDLRAREETAVDRLRIFAGYAGWGAGQLEGEIANDAWWVVDGHLGDLFFDRPAELWATVMRRNGGELAWFAHYPDDATLN